MLRLEAIDGFACPHCSARRSWRFVDPPSKRLNSITAIARCGQCGRFVFIKALLPLGEEVTPDRARREFKTACELHDAFPVDRDVGVVRPLAQLGIVLLFEFVDGRTIAEVLRCSASESRHVAMAKVGTWFARFHHAGSMGDGDGGFAARYRDLRTRCSYSAHTPPLAATALRFLQGELDTLYGRTFGLARMHGDAKPDNFILAGERIVAVDVHWRHTAVAEMDLAQFLVQFAICVSSDIEQEERCDLERTFLDAYCALRGLRPQALEWMRVYFWLSFWISAKERGLLYRWRMRELGKRLRECLDRLGIEQARAGASGPA